MKKQLFLSMAVLGCIGSIFAENNSMTLSENINTENSPVEKPIQLMNLNLNKQGNVIVARPGEKIFSTLNFYCNPAFMDPDSLHQIVIGYENLGPQKCIFNELGYRFREGILSFFIEAPETPGVYEVQCDLLQARSSVEATQSWWDESSGEFREKITIGRIIVK